MKKWIPIQLKRSLANPFAWIVAVLALAAFLLTNSIVLHEPQTTAFGLYTEGGVCARHMEEFFSDDEDTTCPCVLYTDEEAMKRDVLRGKLDCAFSASANLDEIVFEEKEEHGITYYQTPSTHEGLIIKEKVFLSVMQAKAEQILTDMAADKKTFPTGDEKLAEGLLRTQREYMEGDDLFHVDFLTASGEEWNPVGSGRKTSLPHKRIVLAGFLVFAASLAFARERYTGEYRSLSSALRTGEKAVYLSTRGFAQTAPLAVILTIALFAVLASAGELTGPLMALRVFILMIFGWIVSALWGTAFSALFKKEIPYLLAMVSVLTVGYLLTASAVRDTVPVLGMIGHLFPMGWM